MRVLQRFGVSLPKALLSRFDKLIRRRGYTNRSEAIRDLIRDRLVDEEWANADDEVVAAVSLVYNHETRDLATKLDRVQHERHGLIVSSMHVHLDPHNCLETIVLRGRAGDLQEVADRLISSRGVKHGRLFRTTIGKSIQ